MLAANNQNNTREASIIEAYHVLQAGITKLPEENRNYIFLNVGEYANYLLRLHGHPHWQILIENIVPQQQVKLREAVACLLESIASTEESHNETAMCGMALRIIQANLDLANSVSPESNATAQLITAIIDRWIKVYNQMIFKGIGSTGGAG